MTSGARLWLSLLVQAGVAATLLVTAAPHHVPSAIPPPLGLALGAAAGVTLVIVLAGRLPPRPRLRRARLTLIAAKSSVLVLAAACEEVVWRWFVLGALVPHVGAGGALGLSSAGFAVSHAGQAPRAVLVHLATGATFGGVFLATGSVAAAIVAHATYNVTVLLALESRSRHPAGSAAPRHA